MKAPIPKFKASVQKGKMVILDFIRKDMARWVSTFKDGTELDIVIKKHVKDRTTLQNAYYFGVVVPILADHFGYDDAEEMHTELKEKFNPIESKITPGKMIGGSTTKLSTEEFFSSNEKSYVERICRWGATEYGIYIPPPTKMDTTT